MRLDDCVAIVTGAGSGTGPNQGIGKAICRRFLEEGAKVAIAEIEEGRGKEVVDDLRTFGEIEFVQVDVSDRASSSRMVDEVKERWGRIDALVNNAGVYGDLGTLMASTMDDSDPAFSFLRKVMAVNMFGVWVASAAVAPIMISQGSGKIVNIASQGAWNYGGPEMELGEGVTDLPTFAYHWSKWNVVGLTRFMAGALGVKGVAVNCIAPGVTTSDATMTFLGRGAPGQTPMDVKVQATTALKKVVTPEDVAAAAAYLVSSDGDLITGQTLHVDGGFVIGGA